MEAIVPWPYHRRQDLLEKTISLGNVEIIYLFIYFSDL